MTCAVVLLAHLTGRAAPPQFRHTVPAPEPILDPPASDGRASRAAPSGLNGVTTIPNGEYQTEPAGFRYSTLFRNTRFPYGSPVTLPAAEPTIRPGQFRASLRFEMPGLNGGIPFLQQGFEPQDADLKIGPFFFKVRSLETAVLHSDNINLDNHPESGTIAIMSLNIAVMAQITEGLRLATSGSFVYLPIQGEAGIAGFGLPYLYDLGYYTGPLTHAQLVWDTNIAGWNVVFADDFQIGIGTYSDDIRSDYSLFEGGRFNEASRAGRYFFSPYGGDQYPRRRDDGRHNDFQDQIVVYSNIVSAETQRLLPGPVRLRARIYREDLWYNQGNRGLPSLREGGLVSLTSERENMRFKPYVSYEAFKTDTQDSFQHIFRLGITGPITDQLGLHAEYGYYTGGTGSSGELWLVELRHTAGPYTQESLSYERSLSDFHDEIAEGVTYDFHQILGPKLTMDAFASHLKYEVADRSVSQFDRTEWRAGLRFNITLGPRTRLSLSGIYTETDPLTTNTLTERADLDYNFTETLLGRFSYQHTVSDSSISDFDYTENLFYLSITKYFP